jgi:CRP-like cAMP-binding protein
MLARYSILRELQSEKDVISKRRLFAANRSIITEGTVQHHLYFIESGRVRVTTRVELKDHRHIQPGLRDLGPGEVFGELALFDSAPHGVSVKTVEDTELLEFEVDPLLEYLDRHPESGYVLLQQLLQLLTYRLMQADCRIKSLFAWGLENHSIGSYL